MSGYEPRALLPATVGPRASTLFVRHHAGDLLRTAATYERAGDLAAAREVRIAVAQMQSAARMLRDSLRGTDDEIAVSGNAAMPSDGDVAPSKVSSTGMADVLLHLRVTEVAEMLDLKERQVRNLCGPDGPLSATKVGREWLIDEASVQALKEVRARRSR